MSFGTVLWASMALAWLAGSVAFLVGGIYGTYHFIVRDRDWVGATFCFTSAVGGLIALIGLLAVVAGDIRFDSYKPDGCYRLSHEQVYVGKTLQNREVWSAITCP